MEYVCTTARFHFFNGQKSYTAEFAYGLSAWFVFLEDLSTDALYQKKINPSNHKSPNRIIAELILQEYFDKKELTVS